MSITNLSLVNYINQNWGNGTQRPIHSNFGEPITITTKLSSDITKSSNEIAHQNSLNLSEKSVRILVISQLGRGQYRTISEAINDAQDGDKIVVKEGIYREGLVINKPLEIIGDGEKSKIILESDNSPCVLMKTDYAIVKGLTLCGRARLKGKNYNTIDIPQGFLILEDCDITSDSLACIAIYGSTTRANISFCKIHNSWNSGLYVCNRGHAIVKNCDIFANHPAGIQISTLGNSTIQDCSIKNNLMGIWLYDNGIATVTNCDLRGNEMKGIVAAPHYMSRIQQNNNIE